MAHTNKKIPNLFFIILIVIAVYSFGRFMPGILYSNRQFLDTFRIRSHSEQPDHSDGTPRINFRLSLNDKHYFDLPAVTNNIFSGLKNEWRNIDVGIDGLDLAAKAKTACPPFAHNGTNPEKGFIFRLRYNKYIEGIKEWALFPMGYASRSEMMCIYKMADILDLFRPQVKYCDFTINSLPYGSYILSQSFDAIFLENKAPDGILFRLLPEGKKDLKIIFNGSPHPEAVTHLSMFFELLKKEDPNLLIKFFDLDYLARIEAMRYLLKAPPSFGLSDNTVILYNTSTGLFYPVINENTVNNFIEKKQNKDLAYLYKLIRTDPSLCGKRNEYIKLLENAVPEIISSLNAPLDKTPGTRPIHDRINDFISRSYLSRVIKETAKKTPPLPKRPGVSTKPSGDLYLDDTIMPVQRFIDKNSDILYSISPGAVSFRKKVLIKNDLIIPRNVDLKILPGSLIEISAGISVVCYGSVKISGTQEEPVTIHSEDPKKAFGVFGIMGDRSEKCFIDHLNFSEGSETFINGIFFSGGLDIYNTDVRISNSRIFKNTADDGVNVKRSSVNISTSIFAENSSDQVDMDFCTGTIRSCLLSGSSLTKGGDDLDLSFSTLVILKNIFKDSMDKGVSAGERTNAIFIDNTFTNNHLGLAAKDASDILLICDTFNDNVSAISSYVKKSFFGAPDSILLYETSFNDNNQNYDITKHFTVQKVPVNDTTIKDMIKSVSNGNTSLAFGLKRHLRRVLPRDNLSIKGLTVGNGNVYISEKNKTIFVSMPQGSPVKQAFSWTEIPGTVLSILNLKNGILQGLKNGALVDLGEYIFRGKLFVMNGNSMDSYHILITTGGVPVINIDLFDENGNPTSLPEDRTYRVPCEVTFYTNRPAEFVGKAVKGSLALRGIPWSDKFKFSLNLKDKFSLNGKDFFRRWKLESSFTDKTLLRNKVAFDLYKQFTYESGENPISPDSEHFEVFINGRYWGLYILMNRINAQFLDLEDFDKESGFNSCLYKCSDFSRFDNDPAFKLRVKMSEEKEIYRGIKESEIPYDKSKNYIMGWSIGASQLWPDPEETGEMYAPLNSLIKFIATSSEKVFRNNIFNLLDTSNFMDHWILIQLTKNKDSAKANKYVMRHKGKDSRWKFVTYDYDGSFGIDWDMSRLTYTGLLKSRLFQRLMDIGSFRDSFSRRWKELRERGIISRKNILRLIDRTALAIKDASKRDYDRWGPEYEKYIRKPDLDLELMAMKGWIIKRIECLDSMLMPENTDKLSRWSRNQKNKRFILTGHTRTNRDLFEQGIPLNQNFLSKIKELSSDTDYEYVMICGDVVYDTSTGIWQKFSDVMRQAINAPSHIAVGNHDINKRGIYEKIKGRTYYTFSDAIACYIFLDTELVNCNITGDQKKFLYETLDKFALTEKKHLFVFMHKPLFFIGNERYKDIIWLTNGYREGRSAAGYRDSNFYADIFPKLLDLKRSGKHVHLIAGDVGAYSNLIYDNIMGIDLICTGIDNKDSDIILDVSLTPDNTVFTPVSLTGDAAPDDIKYFSIDHWKDRINAVNK